MDVSNAKEEPGFEARYDLRGALEDMKNDLTSLGGPACNGTAVRRKSPAGLLIMGYHRQPMWSLDATPHRTN